MSPSASPMLRSAEARIWVADTEPNQRFTLYTRGNVGEVFPHVMTALTGTLIGDVVRQGHEWLVMRLFGVRMPAVSASDADERVMGDVADVPP